LENLLDEISRIVESSSLQRLHPAILDLKKKLSTDEVRLAFLGQMKRGKSSLLNALLGENILPTGILPLTSVVTELRYATSPHADVQYRSGSLVEIAISEIAEYVTEAKNPGNRKQVLSLQLCYPSELLREGLVLVDTPGFGSTYSHNTASTLGYLANVDAAVVVFSIDPPITELESNFIRDIRKDIPHLIFVLNKIDLVSDEEVETACRFLRDELVNRLGLVDFSVFPLATRTEPINGVNETYSTGMTRFMEHLHHFAKHSHDQTLFSSILREAGQILDLASFALLLSQRFSSLSAAQVEDKRRHVQRVLDETARDTAGIRSLLREEQLDFMKKVDADLATCIRTATPWLEERLSDLQRANPHTSGRALGRLLEEFFNEQIDEIFRDWRKQEDAQLSRMLDEIVSGYTARANSILDSLMIGIGSLVDLQTANLKVTCGLAMDSRVSYSIERIFISLDSFLLVAPPFLQRRLVFQRARNSVPLRLDRNSGRLRFDYLERMERTFHQLEHSLTSQIEDVRQMLMKTLEMPRSDVALWNQIKAVQSYVSALAS
jgi:Predicted GTPase